MLRSWFSLIASLIGALLLSRMAMAAEPVPVPQLFLIQNSGWMEPFYTDPQSRFRTAIADLVTAAAPPGTPVIVAAFNKDGDVPGARSPQTLFKGGNAAPAVTAAINGISLPRKANGAYADSDFVAAITDGAKTLLGGKSGIIWFISNNQNAPDGAAGWQARSQAFSKFLLESSQITRIYAHPVRNAVTGTAFGRKEGYIIYALAYGKAAAPALDAIVAGDAMRTLLGSPVARLKPLDTQTARFVLDKPSTTLYQQGDWFQIIGDGRPQTLILDGRLENRLYPFEIASADLRVTFQPHPAQPGLEGMHLAARPQRITDVPALGKSAPVSIELALPALPRLGLLDAERRASGVLSIRLENITYRWDANFLDRLTAVPGTDTISTAAQTRLVAEQLPDVFVAPLGIRTSNSDMKLQVIARHGRLWLWLSALGLAALAAALAWWFGRNRRKTSHDVDLDGERRRVALARGEKVTLANAQGKRFVVEGRGESAPKVTVLKSN